MFHWLAWALGLTSPDGAPYLAWSGVIPGSAVVVGVWGFYARHRCHTRWCPMPGRRRVGETNWVVCGFHHPRRAPTASEIAQIPPRPPPWP